MLTLNIGCGINRKRLYGEEFQGDVFHIDKNPSILPDIVWDLNDGLPCRFSNNVDEIHAYHIIEHIGKMGETDVWFRFWKDCWKALKPGGLMYVIAPYYLHESSVGDPTHARLICRQTFHFLDRSAYNVDVGGSGSAMSQLGIDFDLPVKEWKFQSNGDNAIPHTIMVILEARKTVDGALIELPKKEAAK